MNATWFKRKTDGPRPTEASSAETCGVRKAPALRYDLRPTEKNVGSRCLVRAMREVGELEEREGRARAVQSQDSIVKQREELGDGHDPLHYSWPGAGPWREGRISLDPFRSSQQSWSTQIVDLRRDLQKFRLVHAGGHDGGEDFGFHPRICGCSCSPQV
ncbi:uncharacterized protein BDZ83DRAFT_732926 [Colletotrichum acutatum]|uniref:Uncharacterized protein n=1 Tax=Glomerella acutata TaxID=27357 RepID=A0AAD8XD91_GLOAC|nr:uncharacterized protein BDZ83DRAFT_732926 [Colletotrichum acutatum]KAK1721255.1 hypothetical protein BDZ83DRAFT_732926 [Colletotrichum acutatum]